MKTITDINQLDMNGTYTYADYLLWKFEERVEILKGKLFRMSPAPSPRHQLISKRLIVVMDTFFKGRKCELFQAPFDVRFPKQSKGDKQIYTVVQPDLCVVCDPKKIDEKGCLGAPDLVIEILSKGNSKKEMKNKFELYEEAGVQEYWLIDPEYQNVFVYVLDNGKYRGLAPVIEGDFITSVKFPDLKINTSDIF